MDIKKEFLLVMDNYRKECNISSFKDKEYYANWLAQTYFFVAHSTPLLGYALPHLKNKALQFHFEHHLGEEERHELLVLKDLEKMGKNINDYVEEPMTQAFYQSQYYKIQFEHGTALLGYILLLEGLAVHLGTEVYQTVKDLHKGSTLFLKVHSEEDPHHLDEAFAAIASLPQDQQKSIVNNLWYSSYIYLGMINSLPIKMRNAA